MIYFADGLRGLVLLTIAAIVALSYVTLRRYASHARRTPAEARRALHIVKVSASHIGLLVIVAVQTAGRFGHDVSVLLVAALALVGLTLSALIDLLYFQRFASTQQRRGDDEPDTP